MTSGYLVMNTALIRKLLPEVSGLTDNQVIMLINLLKDPILNGSLASEERDR